MIDFEEPLTAEFLAKLGPETVRVILLGDRHDDGLIHVTSPQYPEFHATFNSEAWADAAMVLLNAHIRENR